MFSKPLFKQSSKANGMLWLIITVATCIMLAVLVLVMGNANISRIQDSLSGAITKNVAQAKVENYSMNFYYTLNRSLQEYEEYYELLTDENSNFSEYYDTIINIYESYLYGNENPTDEDKQNAINQTYSIIKSIEPVINTYIKEYFGEGMEDFAISAIENLVETYAYNSTNMNKNEIIATTLQETIFDAIYQEALEDAEAEITLSESLMTAEESAQIAVSIIKGGFSAYLSQDTGSAVDAQTFAFSYIPTAIETNFSSMFAEYDLDEDQIYEIAVTSLVSFQALIDYKYSDLSILEIDSDEVLALIDGMTESIMDELDSEVSNSLSELGDMDVFALVVGEIFFKIAGILLPMIYIILTANNLISGQVDSGSMAYTLSTPVRRRTVAFTQACFLILSLLAMFICTTLVGIICLQFVKPEVATINAGQMALYNLGSFVTLFAIAGICFLTSCIFNRSKQAMATGGGISMYFLVATILGLFGSASFPSVIRIDAMNIFNYTTIISLFDTNSILTGGLTFLWKLAILLVVGVVCFIVGQEIFKKKDLPL